MPHCKGAICREFLGQCVCLCTDCAVEKRAEGFDVCRVCNRTASHRLPDGTVMHYDGSNHKEKP